MKRVFDFISSLLLILWLWPLLLLLTLMCAFDTASNGVFTQIRIGQYAKHFTIYKFRTHHKITHQISPFGHFMRRSKLDELPQLLNILVGNMTWIGPRPDVPGYFDTLEGDDRKLLQFKPGITGPASLKYKNEEEILAVQLDPIDFNDRILFPDKVKVNLNYFKKRTWASDLYLLWCTFAGKDYHTFTQKFDE